MELEKMFADHTSDQGSVPKVQNKHRELNGKRPNSPTEKRAEELNRHFPKEDTQMTGGHVNRCSTPLTIQAMQATAATRYPLTPVDWLFSKR